MGATDVTEGAGIRVSLSGTNLVVTNRLFEGNGSNQSIYGGTTSGGSLTVYGSIHGDNGPVILPGVASFGETLRIGRGTVRLTEVATQYIEKYSGNFIVDVVNDNTFEIHTNDIYRAKVSSAGFDVSFLSASGIVSIAPIP